MSRFFVGQRVRKARGVNGIGATGVVVSLEAGAVGTDLSVRLDRAADGDFKVITAGQVARSFQAMWEPVLPKGHRAGDYSFHELMDRCREGVTA